MPLQIRRGTNAERLAMSVPLAQGELLYVTDDQRLYIGNGTTLGGVMITGFTTEDAQDAAAGLFTSGTHNGITFTYGPTQDGANRIDATVDLSGYTGIIAADAFKGSVFADDSTLLVDGISGRIVGPVFANVTGNLTGNVTGDVTGNLVGFHTGDVKGSVFGDDSTMLVDGTGSTFNLDGTVKGHIVPNANEQYDLGSSSFRFRDLYLSGSSIKLGSATITSTGAVVDLPIGSTINGVPISTVSPDQSVITDIQGSVFADDSSILVDAVDKVFYGSIDIGDTLISNNSITGNNFYIGTTEDSLSLVSMTLDNNLQIRHTTDPGVGRFITVSQGRGTFNTPAAVQPGDLLGGFLMRANTDASTTGVVGNISFIVDPTASITPGGSYVKGQLVFTCASDSTIDPTKSAGLDSNGGFQANHFVATKWIQNTVYANDAARSAGVPSPQKGMMVFMESGTAPAATNQLQVYDGSNWVNIS